MTRSQHLRRVAILCCHCLRNLAFYKAGWHNGKSKLKGQFGRNVNSNFLDIAVLEWCKLFADTRGKHFWRKAISGDVSFQNSLLAELGLTEAGGKAGSGQTFGHLSGLERPNVEPDPNDIDCKPYTYPFALPVLNLMSRDEKMKKGRKIVEGLDRGKLAVA
ncbi:hypothetical protein [Geomonas ferrireducens]|uniref:hypothetical protein n=1 Tax=Geomonas ferrireducens TaxID=2570227 RepID=UPI0010A8D052|nr:hypothetical protein [Geomonas ferrireducens]